MYIDRTTISEYPFTGRFYTMGDTMPSDGDMLADDVDMSEENIKLVLETACDVQETNKAFNSGSIVTYKSVYFPFDKSKQIPVRMGMRFKCDDCYMPVDGIVLGVYPSQLGGCEVQIKEVGVVADSDETGTSEHTTPSEEPSDDGGLLDD